MPPGGTEATPTAKARPVALISVGGQSVTHAAPAGTYADFMEQFRANLPDDAWVLDAMIQDHQRAIEWACRASDQIARVVVAFRAHQSNPLLVTRDTCESIMREAAAVCLNPPPSGILGPNREQMAEAIAATRDSDQYRMVMAGALGIPCDWDGDFNSIDTEGFGDSEFLRVFEGLDNLFADILKCARDALSVIREKRKRIESSMPAAPPATETRNEAPPSNGEPPEAPSVGYEERATAAAYALLKEGRRVSIQAVCKRAGLDRSHLSKRYPGAIKIIKQIGAPDRNPRRGSKGRDGRIEAVDEGEE